MEVSGNAPSRIGLDQCGITSCRHAFWNLTPAELIETCITRGEAHLADNGSLVVKTGKYTGRSPNDKFIVEEPSSKDRIAWGKVNRPLPAARFASLHDRMTRHLSDRDLFVHDCFAGADPRHRLAIRVVTESAYANLFAKCLFISPELGSTQEHNPDFTVICAPSFKSDPATDGTNSEAVVAIDFGRKLVLIGGTAYCGEIKKSIFSVANYVLPLAGVFSMHCSANVGSAGDTALFFGLSGTGKTTLSADPQRPLIGDDEHGWTDQGVFNIEGGCYAKCILLSEKAEPDIYRAIRFGALCENVDLDPDTRRIDFNSSRYTENTRVAYPLEHVANARLPSMAGHPRNVVFLTCDAFGVLPPISRLSAEQAMYHFLSGYTAKVAGTERGVTEPKATFSTCFGEPFLPLPPIMYAGMMGRKLKEHQATCWLVNTGWTGGGYGVGHRMNLAHTRAMVSAALDGSLARSQFDRGRVFGVEIPLSCPGVPSELLHPANTWPDKSAYEQKARQLTQLFKENFQRFTDAPAEIAAAGPVI